MHRLPSRARHAHHAPVPDHMAARPPHPGPRSRRAARAATVTGRQAAPRGRPGRSTAAGSPPPRSAAAAPRRAPAAWRARLQSARTLRGWPQAPPASPPPGPARRGGRRLPGRRARRQRRRAAASAPRAARPARCPAGSAGPGRGQRAGPGGELRRSGGAPPQEQPSSRARARRACAAQTTRKPSSETERETRARARGPGTAAVSKTGRPLPRCCRARPPGLTARAARDPLRPQEPAMELRPGPRLRGCPPPGCTPGSRQPHCARATGARRAPP